MLVAILRLLKKLEMSMANEDADDVIGAIWQRCLRQIKYRVLR